MPRSKVTVLVVGATGSIGRLVVEEALRQGHAVRALVRSEAKARQLPQGAKAVIGDVTHPERWSVRSRVSMPLSSPTARMAEGKLDRRVWTPAMCVMFCALSARDPRALRS
jgi:nucleoside-diphosphate-sugar epimerase